MARKRESRNRQLTRILQLLNLLSNNPTGYTMFDLRTRLRATRRTVYRDIAALAAAAIFLDREEMPNREVRYRLPHEYRFVKTSFDESELFSLFFAKNLLKPLKGTPFGRGIESALEKIYRLLPEDVQNYCFFTESFFVFRQPGLRSYREAEALIGRLREAILKDRCCEILYRKPKGEASTHVLHPYFMAYVDGLLYVIGHSEQRRDRRTFRVDRISRLRLLPQRFERPVEFQPENFDVDEHLGRSLRIYGGEDIHSIVISFPQKEVELVRDRTWHVSQKIRPGENGRLVMSLELPITPEVESWILSFGDKVRVLQPSELVRRVSRSLQAAAGQYRA